MWHFHDHLAGAITEVMLTVDEEDEECVYDSPDEHQQGKRGFEEDTATDEELQTIKDERQTLEEKDSHKPSSAKSDTTSVRPFDLSNEQRSGVGGQPLRIVQSSPALKKGSPTRKLSYGSATYAIRAVRNLSYAIQSAFVVRPHSVTKSTRNCRKPPIADFYEEMTKVETLNPLRTLHNSIPLKEMDSFFDKTAGQTTEALVTPMNTPSRKSTSRKLGTTTRRSNSTQLMEKLSSVASEDTEERTDLLTEAVEKLDS